MFSTGNEDFALIYILRLLTLPHANILLGPSTLICTMMFPNLSRIGCLIWCILTVVIHAFNLKERLEPEGPLSFRLDYNLAVREHPLPLEETIIDKCTAGPLSRRGMTGA